MKSDLTFDSREHLGAEQFADLLYREAAGAEEQHLRGCPECQSELHAYRATLNHLDEWCVPARPPAYGSMVWTKIASRVPSRRRPFWSLPVFAWVSVSALGLLLLAVLLVNRRETSPRSTGIETAEYVSAPNRLLDTALEDHIERTSALLAEVENARGDQTSELLGEHDSLRDLIAENRLYRDTAEQQQDRWTAALLSELELVLVDLQHVSGHNAPGELREVQQRIANTDLRFKLRVADSSIRPRLMKAAGVKL
jgi:hypothetical protein